MLFRSKISGVHVNNVSMAIHRQGNIIYVNAAYLALLGFSSSAEVLGRHAFEFVHPDDLADSRRRMGGLAESKPLIRTEIKMVRPDGKLLFVEVVECSINYQGEAATQVIYRDIGVRKQSEEKLKRREAALATAQRITQLGNWEFEFTGETNLGENSLYWSDELFRILGYEPGEIEPSRANFLAVFHPDDRERLHKSFEEAIQGKRPSKDDFRIVRRDGSERIVQREISIVWDEITGKPSRLVGTIQDVTDRRQADERMRRLVQAVENSAELIAMSDREGLMTFANKALLRTSGYTEKEIIGRPLEGTVFSPSNSPVLVEEIRNAIMEKGEWRGEFLHGAKDGSDFPAYLTANQVKDGEGNFVGVVGIAEDITERKSLEKQLMQAQKMEAVGRLSGGIAHDFNNLLGVIIGHSELIEERLPSDATFCKDVQEIKKAAQRAASLTHQLLAFSRHQVLESEVFNLNTVVLEMEKMLRRLIGEDIDFQVALSPKLGQIRADQGQIGQVIMNLAVNARDAMPQGGKLTIETANLEADDAYARRHGDVSPGPFVMLSVSDTGTGMDADTKAHIFEPFFTTKEVGKGTGLGLSTVFGVVKQSGGYMSVRSEIGQGANFTILLPRVNEQALAPARIAQTGKLQKGSETILLVEDEEPLRKLIVHMLTRGGYTVLEAANGPEALKISRQTQGAIHLLLTDVVMPGQSGPVVAAELVALRPDMKILYMSGYTEFAAQKLIGQRGQHLLQKPFTPQNLMHKVRETLENKSVPSLTLLRL